MAIQQKQPFAASYDLAAKVTSILVTVGFVAFFVVTKSAIFGALGLCVIALTYLYSPRSYEISNREILIKRLIGAISLPLDGIHELRAGTDGDFRACTRLWASGGLFGYFGLFKTTQLGKCRWYMTNRHNSVIIVTDVMTVVISPDDVPGFLASARSVVPVPETSAEQATTIADSTKARVNWSAWIGGLVAVLTISILGVALFYSPGAPKYTLTSKSLTIHDHFYPIAVKAADVDVNNIKVVDIRTDSQWAPTTRTNGFANAHYHSGWFQVSAGVARMYWADGAQLVLLPPSHSGAPVLFEVKDPELFVAKIRQQWANE
jgi:hypothetical protein